MDSLPDEEQEALVKYAVRRGAILRKENSAHRAAVTATKAERQVQVGQARDLKGRNSLANTIVKESIKTHTITNIATLPQYTNLPDSQQEAVEHIIKSHSINGKHIIHTWNEDDGIDKDYHGVIMKQRKRTNGLLFYDIKYWVEGADPSTAEPVPDQIPAESLLVDILTGDCKFL